MLMVVAVTLVTAQWLILPEDAEKAAQSALWSLGIEEPFYIFWPLILMAAYRSTRAKGFFAVAALIGLGSFVVRE